jgi:hypothetical protein
LNGAAVGSVQLNKEYNIYEDSTKIVYIEERKRVVNSKTHHPFTFQRTESFTLYVYELI